MEIAKRTLFNRTRHSLSLPVFLNVFYCGVAQSSPLCICCGVYDNLWSVSPKGWPDRVQPLFCLLRLAASPMRPLNGRLARLCPAAFQYSESLYRPEYYEPATYSPLE